MKTIVKIITVLFASLTLFTSCNENKCIDGQGSIVTQTLALNTFNSLELYGSNKIIFSQGTTQEVKVIGHQNIIDELDLNVINNTLQVDFKEGCYKDDVTFEITLPTLAFVSIGGSGDVIINDFDNQTVLEAVITGSGAITLNEFEGASSINIDIEGSGYFEAKNDISTLDNLDITISGSGSFDGFEMSSNNATVDISGSGNARLSVIENLDVLISGSGKVYYKGSPTISENISGSGSLIDAN